MTKPIIKPDSRLRRRGTWGLLAGLGTTLSLNQLIDAGNGFKYLIHEQGWFGLLAMIAPLVFGVATFAIEKRGDVNQDGRMDRTDVVSALEMFAEEFDSKLASEREQRNEVYFDQLEALQDKSMKLSQAESEIHRLKLGLEPEPEPEPEPTREVPTIPRAEPPAPSQADINEAISSQVLPHLLPLKQQLEGLVKQAANNADALAGRDKSIRELEARLRKAEQDLAKSQEALSTSERKSVSGSDRKESPSTSPTVPSTVSVPAASPQPTTTTTSSVIPLWTPAGEGQWVQGGKVVNPKAGRAWRTGEVTFYGAVIHSTNGSRAQADAGFASYERWGRTQTGAYSGYHIVCALDLDEPRLLAHPLRFKMFGAREWNSMAQIAMVANSDHWDDLTDAEAERLTEQVASALIWLGCTEPAVHPKNGRLVADGNELRAFQGNVEMPQPGSFVAHDWLISDRDNDGKIEKADDWKRDPGEPAMAAIGAHLLAPRLVEVLDG